MPKYTVSAIAALNKKSGGHFFERAKMKANRETLKSFRMVEEQGKLFIERKSDEARWRVNPETGRITSALNDSP